MSGYENVKVEIEQTEEKMTVRDQIKQKAKSFWETNKENIIFGGVLGAVWLTCGLSVGYQIRKQEAFDKRVKEKYGQNAFHGSWLISAKKRQADLEVWEKGNSKNQFKQVFDFAKTLNLKDDDYYTIVGTTTKDGHSGNLVMQVVGESLHGELT